MSQLVEDCPRCGARRIAFEVLGGVITGQNYGWQTNWEIFCLCGHCHHTTVFQVQAANVDYGKAFTENNSLVKLNGAINKVVVVKGYVSRSDRAARPAPEHLPENILAAFNEGAKCLAVGCHNAAGTMFRLCIDITTKGKLPEGEAPGLNHRVRRDLGLRLPWLFDNRYLPEDLRDLSTCIKEDGNDGAHQGNLTEADALDLLDFTEALLERLFTEPERLRLARERREQRRA